MAPVEDIKAICMPSKLKHILVTGPHRSGTTWIGNTIAEYGGMRLLLEPFNRNYPPYGFGVHFDRAYTHFESSNQQAAIKAAFDDVLLGGPRRYASSVCRATDAGWKSPLRFGWHWVEAIRKPRVLVKDPIALFSAGWLAERYDLNVVCTMRSPWSFVASLKVANWGFSFKNLVHQDALIDSLPQKLATAVRDLEDNKEDRIEKWSVLWNVLHHQIVVYQEKFKDWQFVRYEDIASKPIEGFSVLLENMGLSMTEHIRDYIESYTSSKNAQESNSTQYQPRDAKKTIDSWKDRLTPEEIATVSGITSELAKVIYPEMTPS